MAQRKIVLYIASSLDGYISTDKHNLDWLFSVEGEGDNGFSDFYNTVDTILIGRTTYDWIMNQEHGNFPYKGKECYVFSRTERQNTEHVTFVHENILELINQLKAKDGKNIWLVGGGDLTATFMQKGLIDRAILTIAPVMIGTGIPLFKKSDYSTKLYLYDIKRHNQFAELYYDVIKDKTLL